MTEKTKKTKKTRVTKEQWFDTALNLLAEGGINNVTIDRLSKTVGVAKTSFYWHFKDRQELLNLMLDYWVEQFTETLTNHPEILGSDPEQAIKRVAILTVENNLLRYDLAIRGWAQTDSQVAKMVENAHEQRFTLVRKLMWDFGLTPKEADVRARLFVTYFSWTPYMIFDEPKEATTKLDFACLDYLLQK